MYVNTNVAALNAWQNLQNTTQNMTGVLQQLSSGLRINSAANDPAGLAISQQMQSQIDGMNQAYQNAQTGVSFLQTADGALSQIQNLLQSMYSLATQSANGTNVGVDRGSLQSEMNQYTSEINSITNQTAFNTKNLLDGILGTVNLAVGANPNQELQFSLNASDAVSLGVAGSNPSSSLFATSATPTNAGLSGLTLLGANSSTNPFGSYGLAANNSSTGQGDYAVEVLSAQQTAVSFYGGALVSLSSANAGTGAGQNGTAVTSTDNTYNAGGTGATSANGSITPDGITYTGTTSQTIELQVQNQNTLTATTGGVGTLGTGANSKYSVSYSTDGGNTWTSVYSGSSAPTGIVSLGSTGVTLDLSKVTAPTLTAAATGAKAGTATSTDQYTLGLTPESAQLQLINNTTTNSLAIGSAITVNGSSPATQVVGDPNTGQAVQVNVDLASLLSDSKLTITATTGTSTTSDTTNGAFNINYATNNAATGSGGTITNKAVANGGLSIMNYAQATTAQTAIQAALTQVSSQRAQVGSLINRLNQASSDLQTSQQNLTAAQGGITNADIALQMANLSKDQVLQQSGVAMLAQANQLPQALLKLLP